jgi:Ca2+-binding EF-hand superfamily protein
VQRVFYQVDTDRSGRINLQELKIALHNGNGQNFKDSVCYSLIAMFDTDSSGTIDIYEFEKLYNHMNQWIQSFRMFDRNNSNTIDRNELMQAIVSQGMVQLQPQDIDKIMALYDPINRNKISFDSYVEILAKIFRLVNIFNIRSGSQQPGFGYPQQVAGSFGFGAGSPQITLGKDEFVSLALRGSF